MTAPTLEPYATQARWTAPAPLPGAEWQALFAEWQALFVDTLAAVARACEAAGPCVIGHIKALALFDGGGYLRVSAVSATHAPTVEGRVPDDLATLSLTLNVLVYGLPAAMLHDITWKTAAALAQGQGLTVTLQPTETRSPHAHPT